MILEYSCAMQRRNIRRRRERNVFKYAIAIAIVFHIYIEISHGAPASYDSLLPQSSDISEYFSDISGCYYNFQRYEEGDRIVTNEPCLNCTCHNRMLMCYLRVCPFTKAIGQDCTIEKKPDQCCPIITCPEVPVKLLTSSTTSSPTPTTQTTEVGFHDNYGCSIHESFYADGAQVPADSKKPCELCYCIRNRTACVMQECTLQVEGCKPVYQEGVCCPVRYDCDYEMTSTLRLQTSGSFTKSTTYAPVVDCHYENQTYADGELITTDKPCEHCYCMRGDIVCAVQECGEPLRGKDCVPTAPPPEKCCPSSYECPTDTQSTESIIKGTDFSSTDFPNRISTFEKLTTLEAATTVKYDRPSTVLSQEEIYHRLGESTSKASSQVTSTEQAKESHSTLSEMPLSDYQPEDVQHDNNAIDDDIHHTTLSNRPHKDESQLSHEGTTEDVLTSSVFSTVKPAFIPDQQTTLTPHIDSDSQFENNQTTIAAHQSESTPSEEITHGLTNMPDQHSVSPNTDLSTTETYIKPSQTTKNDANEVVEKVTEPSHKSPTTLIDVSESFTTTSETVTKTPSQPANTDDQHQPLNVVSNDQTQEYQTETNQYSSVTKDYTKDKITTIREEIASNKISVTDVTHKVSELEDEQTTESLNTISNKNTESVVQDDSPLDSKPQVETQRPKISVETTTIDSGLLQNSETKPQSPIDTTSETLGGEEKETTTATAGIPGEGSCLVDGITYENSSIIESSNPCHSKCVCLSSIPTCTLVKCNPPPNDPKCMPIQIKPESCCPAYVCGGNDPASPESSIPSDSHIVLSHQPSEKYTTEEVVSTTIVPLRSSTSGGIYNDINDQNLQNTIDVQEKQTAIPSNDISASELSTDKPLTSSAVPLLNQVTSSDSGPLLDETNNEVSNDEQGIRLPDHNPSQATIKEPSGFSTSIPQETSTAVDKDAPVDVTSYIHEQPSSSSAASNEITVTTQRENDLALPESNSLSEQHDQTLSTVLPEVSPNKAVDNAQEISTLNSVISESNYTSEEGQGEVVTITSLPVSSTIKHSATDSTLDSQFATTIKADLNAVSENSEEESGAGTTLPPVSNELPEENLIVSQHSSVTIGNSETTDGVYETDENVADVTTITVHEFDNVDTKSSSLASPTTEQQKLPATSTALTTVVQTNDNDEISGVASTEYSSESADETTSSPEQIHTTVLLDNDLSQKISSSLPTTATSESVKFTTDRTTSSQTEVYESTVASSEPAQSYETTQIIESSSNMAETDAKPEDETTTVLGVTSSTSLLSNDITLDSNNVTNKIGNIPTEYSLSETSSVSDSNLYEMETTTEIESTGANEKDDRTTIPPFSASSSSHSPHLTESIDSLAAVNETGFEGDSSPTTISHQEEFKTNTTADQKEPVSLTTVSATMEPEPSTATEDTRPLSSTEKQASAIPIDSSSVTPETTSFTSSFEPIQHSTWTRKPTQETITSTSEASYSPQPSMYPQGIDHSSSGAEAGTSMEEYDEDNGAFGPGTCRYAGKVYVSAQQIPRDDPCDFCFCFRSDIICLQQSCPPPIYGCRQEPILGFCCPRYECPVASYPSQNSTAATTTSTTSTTLAPSRPPRYPAESYRSSVRRTGCLIHGYFYSVGDEISIASGPCLECTCGSDGRMKCDPKSCSPEPYVQQMMAESAYRKR